MKPDDPPHIIIAGADSTAVFAALSASKLAVKVTLLTPEIGILPTWKDDAPAHTGLTSEIWDPTELASHLVAGEKAMLGPFTRYGPGDFETWVESNGRSISVSENNVVFAEPKDNTARFFQEQLDASGVNTLSNASLRAVDIKSTGGFWLTLTDERTLHADRLIIAGGGLIGNPLRRVIEDLGHQITECHPALTGFHTQDPRIRGILGPMPAPCELRIGETDRRTEGHITLEPWGFSGPAVWALSAKHTESLHKLHYRFPLRVSWLIGGSRAAARLIDQQLRQLPGGRLQALDDARLPTRLWKNLLSAAHLTGEESWDSLTPPQRSALIRELAAGEYEIVKKKNIRGVSSALGGVENTEVDFRTMASRLVPELYFAGNVLDVCATRPEINLQIDWTTGWIAGEQAASSCL